MGTHFKGEKKKVQSLNSFIKLSRASESIRNEINIALKAKRLSESQFFVLDALYFHDELLQKEIAEKLLKSGGNITMVIDNLEKLELVKRTRGDDDRRHFKIRLTNKGVNIYEEISPSIYKIIFERFKVLNNSEHELFQQICKAVGKKKF
ncbi:MAG: MarR family transcriptional regulator [Ignavibacteriaceae bacterium]|nr:MarR family transcriptional regulator [Ignavibacteriaceae bacterium]